MLLFCAQQCIGDVINKAGIFGKFMNYATVEATFLLLSVGDQLLDMIEVEVHNKDMRGCTGRMNEMK